MEGEEEVFQVIVKWLERDESRKQSFFKLFCHIRLVYVLRSFVFNDILPHPLVKDSTACTGLVLDTMKELSYGTEECYFAQPSRRCLKTHEDAIVTCGEKKTLCYIPSGDKWYKLADITKTLRPPYQKILVQSAMSACHGKLYITAQTDIHGQVAERYDPAVNCWAPAKSFGVGCSNKFAAVINFQGFLYIIGGWNEGGVTANVRKYNPDTNLWQEASPMSIARCGVCAVADQNSLYAIGGQSNSEPLDVVERFDPETNSWSRIATIHGKRAFACGGIVSGKVFVFGGLAGIRTSQLNLIEVYDVATNVWSSTEWMGAPKYIYNAVSFKGKIFVLGLLEQGRSHKSCLQVSDVNKNEWQSCSSLPVGTQVFTIASLRIPRDILDLCEVKSQE